MSVKRIIRNRTLAGAFALTIAGSAFGQTGPSADALFADGRFSEAGAAYEAALQVTPGDEHAMAGLARIRLYQGQEAKAEELAAKALAISPDDPVAAQTRRMAQLRLGAGQFQIQAPPGETVVPFVRTDPLPVVQITLGKDRQALFLIETGGPDITIGPDLAKELGLAVADAGQGVFAGGRRAQVQRTVVPELTLGAVTVSNVPAGVLPSGGVLAGNRIEGIIGTGLLRHFLATLDYCGGRLVLAPRAASAGFEQKARASGANIVPMWFVGDHFMFSRAHLQKGAEHQFLIDTGMAGGGLGATKETLDEAGVALDPANARTGMGGGGAVSVIPFRAGATLGSMSVDDVPGNYSPNGDPTSIFPFKVGGMLSHMFFRQTRLTFDFDAMKLVTRACPAASS